MNDGIYHLELPGRLTLAIHPYHYRVAARMHREGIRYTQKETNPGFWEFLFRTYAPQSLGALHRLFNTIPESPHPYLEVLDALGNIRTHPDFAGLRLEVSGLFPADPDVLRSSEKCLEFLKSEEGGVYRKYAAYLAGEATRFRFVSLGADSAGSLLFGMALAQELKQRTPGFPVVLGRHHYENFSLLHSLDRVVESGKLFESLDGISLYEEYLPGFLAGYCRYLENRDMEVLENGLFREKEDVLRKEPATGEEESTIPVDSIAEGLKHYIRELPVDPGVLHYTMPLIDNRCYFGKCVFCAQIEKHAGSGFYEEKEALTNSLFCIGELYRAGVRFFSFMDEALRPKDLHPFVEAIERNEWKITWNMRLIADVRFSRELIEKLAHSGCREVLFGLETIHRETAVLMGKVSRRSQLPDITDLVFDFSSSGIHLILSMIYGFPGAPPGEVADLNAFARKLLAHNRRVQFIFNRFALFGNTEMYRRAALFGLEGVENKPASQDLDSIYEYRRETQQDAATAMLFDSVLLGVPSTVLAEDSVLRYRLGELRLFDYHSFGFTYENTWGKSLYEQLKTAQHDTTRNTGNRL